MFETTFTKNDHDTSLVVERQFSASKSKVWKAWTKSKMLEQWWAPKPWKAVTESFAFTPGGSWHYYMAGPKGEKRWALIEYETIMPEQNFTAVDAFSDEDGNKDTSLPVIPFKAEFLEEDGITRVRTTNIFKNMRELQKLIDMGMTEGLAMAHKNLDKLLAKQT